MIKSYEVCVAECRFKTLLVKAESEAAAEQLAEDAYYAGEYGFDEEPELAVLEVTPATDTIYQITYCEGSKPACEDDSDDLNDLFDDDEDDELFGCCECCALKDTCDDTCDNETKLKNLTEKLTEDFLAVLEKLCTTYGEEQ